LAIDISERGLEIGSERGHFSESNERVPKVSQALRRIVRNAESADDRERQPWENSSEWTGDDLGFEVLRRDILAVYIFWFGLEASIAQ
jgi:hypothetical protein